MRVEARFFFQPPHLRGQATDLGVEFFELLLVGSVIGLNSALSLEEGWQTVERSCFPGADLVGMDVVVGSDLCDRLLFLKGFSDDFGFEGG